MSLTAFLAQNAEKVENVKYVASTRFRDEEGTPMEWEIRCISGDEDEKLRRASIRRALVPGKKSQFTSETDYNLYLGKLAVACTAYPNLHAQELQNSYSVMDAEALLKRMLTPGEYADYLTKVQVVCGFEQDLSEEKEEAKN